MIAYQQNDAIFRGIEGEVAYDFNNGLTSTFLADHVRGKLRNKGGDLARIPADRVGLRIQQTFNLGLDAQVELWRVQQQNHIADYETKNIRLQLAQCRFNLSRATFQQRLHPVYACG